MSPSSVLRAIAAIAVAGVAFSGYLTWRELAGSGSGCSAADAAPFAIFGYPPCVYGLVMYVLVLVLALLGLRRDKPSAGGESGRPDRP